MSAGAHSDLSTDGSDLEWPTKRATELCEFLEQHRSIACALIKSFFLEDHWNTKLPHSWHEPLQTLSLAELADLLESGALPPRSHSWPDSLRTFVEKAHSLRLPGQLRARGSEQATKAMASGWKSASGRCAEEEQLATALRDSVKPKKMHEIVHLSRLVDAAARAGRCGRLVDVGSGLGYLSRTLAYEYNWPVLAVESSAENVAAANAIDVKTRRKLCRRLADGRDCVRCAAALAAHSAICFVSSAVRPLPSALCRLPCVLCPLPSPLPCSPHALQVRYIRCRPTVAAVPPPPSRRRRPAL